jgi:copper transport protein
MPRVGRAARPLLVLALVALGVVLSAPGASAHANLRASDPAEGSVLQQGPDSILLSFTEPPELSFSKVQLLDATGSPVETGAPGAEPGDENSLRVPVVGPLARGTYTVSWRVVSKTDGHTTAGAFAFGVGVEPGAVPPAPKPKAAGPSPLEVASRWLMILGLSAALGGAVCAAFVFGPPPAKVLGQFMFAGGVLALAGIAGLAFAQRSSAGAGFGALLKTPIGAALLWRAGYAVGVVGFSAVALHAKEQAARKARYWVGVAALGAMLAEVLGGHADAASSFRNVNIAAQWVHFAAAGIWIGGLAALLLGLRGGAAASSKGAAVRRFSGIAGVALFAVIATGTFRAFQSLPSWGALFSSGYGRSILVKTALLLVLAGLGAVNRYRNVSRAGRDLTGLRRISRAEIAVATVIFGATALLTTLSPPPRAAALGPTGPVLLAQGSDFATIARVRLEIRPGRPGPNDFVATVRDYDTGRPFAADRVQLRFVFVSGDVGDSTLELQPDGAGVYRARGSNLSLAGRYRITVVVQTGADSFEVPLSVATPCGARVLSSAEPTIYELDLPGEASVQAYADPGTGGVVEVHFTYFTKSGGELALPKPPAIQAVPAEGAARALEVRRFSPGHFVADATLPPGDYRFESLAKTADGTTLSACFDETIGG